MDQKPASDGLPVFSEGDEPRPWWIVRGYDAWCLAYDRVHGSVPFKRNAARRAAS